MTGFGTPTGDDIAFELPHGVEAAALARRYVADCGADIPDDLLADAQLLVSEIVTNAVLHGRPSITLRLRLHPPGIGVAVADGGDVLPPSDPAPAGPQSVGGRGLVIVDHLATAWGIDPAPTGGKTVWFELRP